MESTFGNFFLRENYFLWNFHLELHTMFRGKPGVNALLIIFSDFHHFFCDKNVHFPENQSYRHTFLQKMSVFESNFTFFSVYVRK
jgi:hypothetical protein